MWVQFHCIHSFAIAAPPTPPPACAPHRGREPTIVRQVCGGAGHNRALAQFGSVRAPGAEKHRRNFSNDVRSVECPRLALRWPRSRWRPTENWGRTDIAPSFIDARGAVPHQGGLEVLFERLV